LPKDLFGQFDRTNLLAPAAAQKYRASMLAPGASKPAAILVHDFLGRPVEFAARWQLRMQSDQHRRRGPLVIVRDRGESG